MNRLIWVNRNPIRKAHVFGSSVVLTLDPTHVKRLNIDEMTFFEEKPVANGIMLEIRKFETPKEENRKRSIG
jgi:hypothetical protein